MREGVPGGEGGAVFNGQTNGEPVVNGEEAFTNGGGSHSNAAMVGQSMLLPGGEEILNGGGGLPIVAMENPAGEGLPNAAMEAKQAVANGEENNQDINGVDINHDINGEEIKNDIVQPDLSSDSSDQDT